MSAPPLTPLAAAVLHVGEPEPERVLEVGCGEGDATLFLAREYPRARVRGVDASAAAIRAATARIGLDPEGRVAFKVGRPRSLPFPDGNFDLVVARDLHPAAAETVRVLRPGAWLVLVRSGPTPPRAAPRSWLVRRLLERRGVETVVAERSGDGSFVVGRLRARGQGSRSV